MSVKNKTRDSATKAQNDKRDAQNDKRDAPKLPVEKRLSVFGELSALHKSILRSLLISKAARKQSAETLTDRFAADISAKAKERLERFLGDLIQTIMSAAEQTDSADVLTIGEAIADGFSYNLASIALFDLYRRARDESKQNEVKKADYGASGASFGARDAANLAALERQFFWLKTSADERTREKIKEVLRSVFEPRDGQPPLAYNEIGAALRAKFGELANAEPSRLQSAGFTLARQNVNIAHAAQMIDDDVPFARVHADMDAKTTPICRSLHGRLIPMAHIKAQLDKITAANSIGATIAARDMSKTAPIYGELPANIGIPPYHFNCRTTILAHYGATSFEALSGARSPLEVLSEYRRGQTIAIAGREKIVRFGMASADGHVRVVTDETYDHPSASDSKKPPEAKIHAALNSITIEADNLDKYGAPNGRTIALSANNIILILQGLEVITAIRPKSAKEAKDYFNRHSVPATRQKITSKVFKWIKELFTSM